MFHSKSQLFIYKDFIILTPIFYYEIIYKHAVKEGV